MGQDPSTPIDESTKPSTLSTRTPAGVAEYILSGRCKRVVVMTGAGISTSAGIPDFRSPETGLYANLARLDLPYAEAVFDIGYFRGNPRPFYTLAHELYPGRYRPTVAHSFVALLQHKGLLHMLFTQNIDCLEREAGVSGDRIVEAHGSFATQRCIDCGRAYPDARMREAISRKEVPRCSDLLGSSSSGSSGGGGGGGGGGGDEKEGKERCGGLVKPDIVFFGEQLPATFFANRSKPAEADLAIVMGTSLTVQPFAALPELVPEGVPRVLLNLERVGGMGSRADDVLMLGRCDDGVRKLAAACGWLEELEAEWAKTAPEAAMDQVRADVKADAGAEKGKTKDERLQGEIDKLTRDVDETLKLSEGHKSAVERHLGKAKGEDSSAAPASKAKQGRKSGSSVDQQPLATDGEAETGTIAAAATSASSESATTSRQQATDSSREMDKKGAVQSRSQEGGGRSGHGSVEEKSTL